LDHRFGETVTGFEREMHSPFVVRKNPDALIVKFAALTRIANDPGAVLRKNNNRRLAEAFTERTTPLLP
jgi:hypothetical protein